MSESVNDGPSDASLLWLYPAFLLPDLLEDDAFRSEILPDFHPSVSLDEGKFKFKRNALFDAIRALEISSDCNSIVIDEFGSNWTATYEKLNSGLAISLTNGETKLLLEPYPGLLRVPAERFRYFELALKKAGLPMSAMPELRTILKNRQLTDDEERAFELTVSQTPISNSEKLSYELTGISSKISTLVPDNLEYYERLCGEGEPKSTNELANICIPIVTKKFIKWDEFEGSKLALVLSSHPDIVSHNGIAKLPKKQLIALANWAVADGDLISLVGMFEVCLTVLPKVPELEPILIKMVQAIFSQDQEDKNGRLNLLSALFCLCQSEISRTKILENWPPFRRRFAALAQASLLERNIFKHIDPSHFSEWAINYAANRYYMQSLCDLRAEPRWLPDYASAEQLKYEFLGRLHNASIHYEKNIPDGDLKVLLTGTEPTSLVRKINLPRSFWPGPLEGEVSFQDQDPPEELTKLIDSTLDTESLNEKSLVALINLRHHMRIEKSKLDKAIAIIRTSNHRFESAIDKEARTQIIYGIAGLAATTRSTELARDVQMILRKIRVDEDAPIAIRNELIIGLIASAAHEDVENWSKFIGDWAFDLAFRVDDTEEAQLLISDLELLASIEPWLRKSCGPAISATGAFLAI